MKHFFVWPSALDTLAVPCAKAWKAKGYMTCRGLDRPIKEYRDNHAYDIIHYFEGWGGYYREISGLVNEAFIRGVADLVTVGGDDQLPPEQGAQWVADAYFSRFPNGEGVLQGCGDKQGQLIDGKWASQRICGSPTFGKHWNRTAFGGRGPFGDFGLRSFYADELLKEVAERLGLLWMNEDICIFHKHWSWGHMNRQPYHEKAQENWQRDQEIFFALKARDFKDCTSLWNGAKV